MSPKGGSLTGGGPVPLGAGSTVYDCTYTHVYTHRGSVSASRVTREKFSRGTGGGCARVTSGVESGVGTVREITFCPDFRADRNSLLMDLVLIWNY